MALCITRLVIIIITRLVLQGTLLIASLQEPPEQLLVPLTSGQLAADQFHTASGSSTATPAVKH
jgi:hypothetical protein